MPEVFNNSFTQLSTINITDCYQVPVSKVAIILSCLVANVDGTNSADVTITIASSTNTELAKLANTIPIPADASLEIIANKQVLKDQQKIRATASAANDLHVSISVLEIG